MLNFKFLKWAALCGLLVFALGGCAKDPCEEEKNHPSEGGGFGQTLSFTYVDALGFPIIAEGLNQARYDIDSVRISYPPNVDHLQQGSVRIEARPARDFNAPEDSRLYGLFVVDAELCGYYGTLNDSSAFSPCYEAYISLMDNGTWVTDTLEVYNVMSGYSPCSTPVGQTRVFFNSELVATAPFPPSNYFDFEITRP